MDRLTKAVGFRYVWDEATKQFAHPAGILVATPEGKIANYLFGVEYSPKDLRLALVDAAGGKIGNAGRPGPPLLLPVQPQDRPLQRLDPQPRAARRRS